MKLVAYIAVVIDTTDEDVAADAISDTMREVTRLGSILLDWQNLDSSRPFEKLKGKYEYENWIPPTRLLKGVKRKQQRKEKNANGKQTKQVRPPEQTPKRSFAPESAAQ